MADVNPKSLGNSKKSQDTLDSPKKGDSAKSPRSASSKSSSRRLVGSRAKSEKKNEPLEPVKTPQEMGITYPVDESGVPKIPEMSWPSLAWEVATSLGSALSGDLFSSGISVPCNMYEPLSILQRSIEFLEFTNALDLASKQTNPYARHAYVAGFALSPLPIAENRWKLDFNPILGETFEYVDARGEFPVRCFTEQVSHHPPVAAVHAENKNFRFYQNYTAVTNFLGNSLEVSTNSKSYVYLKETKEEFLILAPKIRVHNLIIGTMWMEYFGELIIDNLTTGDMCSLKFSKTGWLASSPNYEVNGFIKDKAGKKLVKLKGAWDTYLNAMFLEEVGDCKKGQTISTWKREKLDFTGKQFQMTPFAWTFNNFTDELQKFVLPSDSRRRPDRTALMQGDVDVATAWKRVAESQQRIEQKARRGEKKEDPWQPVWFKLEKDHENLPFYNFTNTYWEKRDEQEANKETGAFVMPDQIKDTAADFMNYKKNFNTQLQSVLGKNSKGIAVER